MLDKKLNLTQSIYEYLPTIKQLFKDFYGEKYEYLVDERLDNATYIGYSLPTNIEQIINKIYEEKTLDLINEFFNKNNIENTKENIQKYFCYSPNFTYKNINAIDKIFNYTNTEEHNDYQEQEFLRILKQISGNDNLEKDSQEYYKTIGNIKKLYDDYNKIISEFKEFQSQYKNYEEYIQRSKKLKDQIHRKYTEKFFKEIDQYLSQKDKDILNNRGQIFSTFKLDCYNILIGSNYQSPTLLDAFTSESGKKLHNDKTIEFIKDSIIKDRIKYYKKIGIDLGDDYNNYLNNPKCMSITPTKERADKIKKTRESLYSQEQEEYISLTTQYQEQLSIIENLNLLDKDIAYQPNNLLNSCTCINQNVIKEDGVYKIYSLLLFPTNYQDEYFDKALIHEFNHLMELSTLEVKVNQYRITCGFEVLEETFKNETNSTKKDESHREFELFNEIINELIAQEITTFMHNQEIYLFSEKDSAKVKGGTTYERNRILVEEFYITYKEEIIESRLTGNLEKLYEKVGYENFINLNKLVSEYGEHFKEFTYYKLIEALKNGRETEDVLFYKKCLEQKNKIITQMYEYQKQSHKKIS